MPLTEPILKKYLNPVFVETGLETGLGLSIARELKFNKLHSVELDQKKIDWLTIHDLSKYIKEGRICLHQGDSGVVLRTLIPTINEPITFWLDAHPSFNPLKLDQCPLLAELDAIRCFCKFRPKILIDDMRIFNLDDRAKIVVNAASAMDHWGNCSITFEDNFNGLKEIFVVT